MFRHTTRRNRRLYQAYRQGQIEHLPVSLQASRNFYKKGTWVNHRTKLKHSARVMNQLGTSTRYATAQL